MAELIKEARSFGDLSENSEYDEAKNEQGKLYSRIAELDEILSNYTIIEEQETARDIVHVGNNVVVKDLEFDETLTYQIVGSQEADPMNGRISEGLPLRQRPCWVRRPERKWWWKPPPATSTIRSWRSRDNREKGAAEHGREEQEGPDRGSRSRTCPKSSRWPGSWPPSRRRGKDPFQQTKFTVSAHAQEIKDHFEEMEGQPSPSLAG